MNKQALRNLRVLAMCQSRYDNMSPDDVICPVCGREAYCDCICDEEVIEIEDDCE